MTAAPWTLRYSAHLGLRAPDTPLFRHSAGSVDAIEQIRYIAGLGFAGVQDNFLKLREASAQARIGAELARLNLTMGSCTNNPELWNKPLWNAEDESARARLRSDLDSTIAAAQRVNGRIATCVTGIAPGMPRAQQMTIMADNLSRLADVALAGGIVLCVEPIADQWIPGLLINHIDEAAAVVRAVAHPAVRLLFDFGHIQMSDGDVLAHFDANYPLIGAIQVADSPGRIDLGAGELDWPLILRSIHWHGWRELIEIEHMPIEESLAGEQRLLQRLRVLDASI